MPNYAYEKKLMTYIFPERGKIEKAQFILDRSGLLLKTCKIPTASLNCKMLRFFSYHSQKLNIPLQNLNAFKIYLERIFKCHLNHI